MSNMKRIRGQGRTFLAPWASPDTHKRELLATALMALRESENNSIFRERLLSDDPALAVVPKGHIAGVEVSAVGPVELVNGWNVRGLFKLRAVALPVATAH